jgi:glycosyltransferase involved in cell wall biosynthesis
MNILIAAPMPPQPEAPGAIPRVLHAELVGLMARHSITLVTIAGPDPAEWAAVDRLHTQGIEVQAVRRTNPRGWQHWQRRWRWATQWLRGRWPWRTVWFWEPEVQRILDQVLAHRAFDLIIVEDNAMGIYRYASTAPRLFTEHEVRRPRSIDWHVGSFVNVWRWLLREADWRRWSKYQSTIWRQFDRIQVFTARDAEALVKLAPDLAGRVRVNPFGIELPGLLDEALADKRQLLFVGNFTHPPNVDAALWLGREIMPLLRQRCPNIRLTLVGIYPPRAVRALASADILVTGPVAAIEPLFEQAAVVVAPLRIGGGMRMKVLHALALGKAVVATSRGADGLTIDDCAPPLVVADSTSAFADAIIVLLNSDERRRAIGRQARAFVAEHFSASAYAQRIEAIYAELRSESTPAES